MESPREHIHRRPVRHLPGREGAARCIATGRGSSRQQRRTGGRNRVLGKKRIVKARKTDAGERATGELTHLIDGVLKLLNLAPGVQVLHTGGCVPKKTTERAQTRFQMNSLMNREGTRVRRERRAPPAVWSTSRDGPYLCARGETPVSRPQTKGGTRLYAAAPPPPPPASSHPPLGVSVEPSSGGRRPLTEPPPRCARRSPSLRSPRGASRPPSAHPATGKCCRRCQADSTHADRRPRSRPGFRCISQ